MRVKRQARSLLVSFPEYDGIYVDAVPARPWTTAGGLQVWQLPIRENAEDVDGWQATDMEACLSSGQGEVASTTVAVDATSLDRSIAIDGGERVVSTRRQSDMRGSSRAPAATTSTTGREAYTVPNDAQLAQHPHRVKQWALATDAAQQLWTVSADLTQH